MIVLHEPSVRVERASGHHSFELATGPGRFVFVATVHGFRPGRLPVAVFSVSEGDGGSWRPRDISAPLGPGDSWCAEAEGRFARVDWQLYPGETAHFTLTVVEVS